MNDLISRKALIAEYDRVHIGPPGGARKLMEDAPGVDAVEVVHGRWLMKETMIRSPFAKNAYCSVCLEETSYAHNYCPNCGANMDGERREGE